MFSRSLQTRIFQKKKKLRKKVSVKRKSPIVLTYADLKFFILIFASALPLVFIQFFVVLDIAKDYRPPHPYCDFPEGTEPDKVRHVPFTAYSSTPDQTDSTPFIAADGTHVYWGMVATNFLPFETCIRIPEMFGNQWFVVHDRKHERFSQSIDIWFPSRQEAIQFGIRHLEVEIW